MAANFSRELADYIIYIIDVSGGDKIPRKGGPGITQADLLVGVFLNSKLLLWLWQPHNLSIINLAAPLEIKILGESDENVSVVLNCR